jgi:hypothetical protein
VEGVEGGGGAGEKNDGIKEPRVLCRGSLCTSQFMVGGKFA